MSHTAFISNMKQELDKLCYKLRVTSKRGKLGFFWQATKAAKKRVFHVYLDDDQAMKVFESTMAAKICVRYFRKTPPEGRLWRHCCMSILMV